MMIKKLNIPLKLKIPFLKKKEVKKEKKERKSEVSEKVEISERLKKVFDILFEETGKSINYKEILKYREATDLSLPDILSHHFDISYEEFAKAVAKAYGLNFAEKPLGDAKMVGEVLRDQNHTYHYLPLSGVDTIIPKNVYEEFAHEEHIKTQEENVWGKFYTILMQAKRKGDVEDIIISPLTNLYEIRFKYVGERGSRVVDILSYEEGEAMINAIMTQAGMRLSEEDVPQSGAIRLPELGLELRVEVIKTIAGKSATARLIETTGFFRETLKSLGYPEEIREKILEKAKAVQGLILVSGPTGSGKSTLISATVNEIRELYEQKGIVLVIKTIEDPVERTLKEVDHVQRREELLEFSDAIKSFLRQNPDIIVVGEVREPDTAQLVIRASRTGHLTFTTIHASNCIDALLRFKDELLKTGETEESIGQVFASNLLMSLNLKLVKLKDGRKFPIVEMFIPDDETRKLLAQGKYWEIYERMKERKETYDYTVRDLYEKGLIDKDDAESLLGTKI
ncbi:MAG: hypothetical protein DSY42_01120 [Aquifex sp.]|nr:MAG: hypothetical protein DSY42_01120 [Aquifex sp.]